MVKISRFMIFLITTCILIVLVITASTIKINERHEEKLVYSMETKISYYAKRCYLENKCNGVVTLKELYDLKYLNEIVHPVTKEIMDETTTIEYKNNEIIINWK